MHRLPVIFSLLLCPALAIPMFLPQQASAAKPAWSPQASNNLPFALTDGPYTGVTGIAINFDGSASSDPKSETLSLVWDFGDGSSAAGKQVSHAYTKAGGYTLTLTVTNTDGASASVTSSVAISEGCSSVSIGTFGALNSFVPSPSDSWHTDISAAAVDPMSVVILQTSAADLAGSHLHPDFGGNGMYGIPYTVVDSISPVPLKVTDYPDESDLTVFPIPASMPIESAPGDCSITGDNHAIVLDKNSCVAYEMYHAQSCSTSTPQWSAASTAIWDFTQTEKRPIGYTSVDAAGLSVFEGLVRYDEIQAGVVNHAIRFTANHTKNNQNNGYFTAPATHAAGTLWGTDNVMGMRIRLKAGYDISSLGPQSKIIATAMKKYGMILADNGSNLFFQGTSDPRWNDDDLNTLKAIPASAFDVISVPFSASYQLGVAPFFPLGLIYDANNHPTGNAPTITSFTASSTSVAAGQSVTLTPVISGASYSYIDSVGFIRGAVTVSPTVKTTYTLTSRNAYGSTSAQVTVDVVAGNTPTLQFTPIADQTFGSAPFTVSASSASSGSVTYSVLSGPASVSGNVVTLLGAGTVTLQANQTAAGNYLAASATISFKVSTGAVLQFAPIADQTFGAAPFAVAASSPSSALISYSVLSGPATISGSTLTLNGTGTVTLQASQAAAGAYAAMTATVSFQVKAATPTLQFAAIADQTYGAAPFAVTASSASNGSVAYAVVSGPATVSANVVTLTGTGTVSLQANQVATANYTAATATASFAVKSNTANLQFAPVPNQTYGAASFTVSATSLSAGTITYTVLSGPATLSANVLTITGAGTVLLQASQIAAGNYAASLATTSFQVLPAAPALTINSIGTKVAGTTPFTPTVASLSQGSLSWSVTGPATVTNNTIAVQSAGIVTVSVSQAADGNYAAATASTTFTVQDFQVTMPQVITIQAGSPSVTTLTISGQEGFTGAVDLTCSLPATMIQATCSATNAQLNATASQGTATITITTVKPFNKASNERLPSSRNPLLFFAMLAPLGFLWRKRKLVHMVLVVLGLALVGITGCGTGIAPATAAGTYSAVITAVSGTTTHSSTVQLVVQ